MKAELRSIITVLFFLMLAMQMTWGKKKNDKNLSIKFKLNKNYQIDFVSTWIKYEEKFYILPSGKIINKPFAAWTEQHQHVAQVLSSVGHQNLCNIFQLIPFLFYYYYYRPLIMLNV